MSRSPTASSGDGPAESAGRFAATTSRWVATIAVTRIAELPEYGDDRLHGPAVPVDGADDEHTKRFSTSDHQSVTTRTTSPPTRRGRRGRPSCGARSAG